MSRRSSASPSSRCRRRSSRATAMRRISRRSAWSPARSSGSRPRSAICSAPKCSRPRSISRAGQKGSSAMPHKRNPVLTENLTGLARMVRVVSSMPATGERRAVARARHLAFLGRALYRPRRDDHARLRADAPGRCRRQACRLSRAHAGEPRPHAGPRPQPARAAGADAGGHRAARIPIAWCRSNAMRTWNGEGAAARPAERPTPK